MDSSLSFNGTSQIVINKGRSVSQRPETVATEQICVTLVERDKTSLSRHDDASL
jgi:hypothetical protein